MNNYKEENRNRLIRLLNQVKENKEPPGWIHVASIAVGGLACIGFSKKRPYVLAVSTGGRGVIDCATGEKLDRDYEEYGGMDDSGLYCEGIGHIQNETILTAGIYGGGLPLSNGLGDSLEAVSPNWPEVDLILCSNYKDALIEGHQSECFVMMRDYLRAYGFSWCGNFIIAATGSDLDIWKRQSQL